MGRPEVKRYINEALRRTRGRGVITNPESMNRWVIRAWSFLEEKRIEECGNNDLACAQHYMEARRWVGQGGSSLYGLVRVWVLGYAGLKNVAFAFGLEDMIVMGNCPPSPPSDEQIYWGLKGADDGWFDYTGGRSISFG